MKATVEIIAKHFDLVSVSHEHISIGGKPLLFPLFSAPFVLIFGANSGMVLASTVGTGVFIVSAALALSRLWNGKNFGDSETVSLGLILTALNPLVLYQFWSAYPNSLFAGFVLLAFYLSDSIATGSSSVTARNIVLLAVTIALAIHTKAYGALLLVTCPMHVLIRHNGWTRNTATTQQVVTFGVMWALLFVALITAKLGFNPLLSLDANSGFGGYVAIFRSPLETHTIDSVKMFVFCILIAFHISLVFLVRKEAWRTHSIAPEIFIGIYIAGLIPYWGTEVNMRYFLPAFPFIAFRLASGALATALKTRMVILGAYSVMAVALILNFNIPWINTRTHDVMSKAYSTYPVLAGWLDNLRMPVQIALKRQIDFINENVPDSSILYWSSDYYKTATHGLAHQLGVKKTLDVRYVLEPSYPPYSVRPVFLTEFMPMEPRVNLWRVPSWATPAEYGNGLFRLDPASVHLASSSGDFVDEGQPLLIRADLNPRDPYKVRDVEFIESGYTIARAQQPPFEMIWPDPPPGRHEIVARVHYLDRESIISSPLDVYVGAHALERTADQTDDLFMEFEDGTLFATQDLLWLDHRHPIVGIRFRNVNVQRGAVISAAHLQLTSVQSQVGRAVFDIRAELSPNANGLRLEDGDLSKRRSTRSHVVWEPGKWTGVGTVESPDIEPILEEVFSQRGWQNGNSLVILIRASGEGRFVQAATEDGRCAPRLLITLN